MSPTDLVKKIFENDGYTYLETVHSLEELDALRLQHKCHFRNGKPKPDFKTISLYCNRRYDKKTGICKFVLLVQRREIANGNGEDEFDVYAHSQHSHTDAKESEEKENAEDDVIAKQKRRKRNLLPSDEKRNLLPNWKKKKSDQQKLCEEEEKMEKEEEEETAEEIVGIYSQQNHQTDAKKEEAYIFLKAVHSLEELDAFRYQNNCKFDVVKKYPYFLRVTLRCHNHSPARGKCPFVLMVKRTAKGSQEIRVYSQSKHNHPVKRIGRITADENREPPTALDERIFKDDNDVYYTYLRTVHSLEELDAFRAQNNCQLDITKRSANFMRAILHCHNRRTVKGMCPFALKVERMKKGSDEFRVYAHSSHNHPIKEKIFLKTVHSLEELDAFRAQNNCKFQIAKNNPHFLRVILRCHKQNTVKGGTKCPFALIAERTAKGSDQIRVYAHSQHNHHIMNKRKSKVECKKKSKRNLLPGLKKKKKTAVMKSQLKQWEEEEEEEVEESQMEENEEEEEDREEIMEQQDEEEDEESAEEDDIVERKKTDKKQKDLLRHQKHDCFMLHKKRTEQSGRWTFVGFVRNLSALHTVRRKFHCAWNASRHEEQVASTICRRIVMSCDAATSSSNSNNPSSSSSSSSNFKCCKFQLLALQTDELGGFGKKRFYVYKCGKHSSSKCPYAEEDERTKVRAKRYYEEESDEEEGQEEEENREETAPEDETIQRRLARALREENAGRVVKWMARTEPERIDQVVAGMEIEEEIVKLLEMAKRGIDKAGDKKSLFEWIFWVRAVFRVHFSELIKMPNFTRGLLFPLLRLIEDHIPSVTK